MPPAEPSALASPVRSRSDSVNAGGIRVLRAFEGAGAGLGPVLVGPLDPNGDVGRYEYVQIVNGAVTVFDKTGKQALFGNHQAELGILADPPGRAARDDLLGGDEEGLGRERLVRAREITKVRVAGVEQARTELYRGQCNCGYWHGAFGGIYLPHLRNAVYHHLIASDGLLDRATRPQRRWVEAKIDDFNFDARQEVQLANDKLVALLAPGCGGQMYELDCRAIRHNLLATLAVLFFIVMTGVLFSGLMISKSVLPTLGIQLAASGVWRSIHFMLSDASVVLLGVHVALHWKWVVTNIGRYVVNPIRGLFQQPAQPQVLAAQPVRVDESK